MFDTPFNHTDQVQDHNAKYMKGQLYHIIDQLEEITGRKFDYERLREVMEISNETCYWWKKATELAAAHPSPLDGFDIFNYMAIIVFARGTTQARDLFHLWHDELQEKIFIPFFTTKSEGTGIGLSLCRQIIRNHNGHLSILESRPGKTIFHIDISL